MAEPGSPRLTERPSPASAPHSARSGSAGASVEFRGVSVVYATHRGAPFAAVEHLSLAVPPGEICVLVGPSGCGKTTTLRLVNRLVEPTAGQVLLNGQDVAASDPVQLRRGIGYVIQQIGLFPHQTVAQNIAAVPRLLKWPEARIRQRTDELLELVGLDPQRARQRYPAQLSGGERQRVGVARALAVEPPLLLMDEPFGAVDPLIRERLQDEFLRLQRTLGMTVLFVTHDIDEAIKLGTRVAVFQRGGHLAQFSTPAELLAHPASEYVAQFVGTDRAIKRLALFTLEDVPLAPLPAQPPDPTMLRLSSTTTLRDALAALLEAPNQTALVLLGESPGGLVTAASLVAAPVARADGASGAGEPVNVPAAEPIT